MPPNGGAKFTLRPSPAFSYIGSVTARHSNSRSSAKLYGVGQGRELRHFRSSVVSTILGYIRQGGRHVGHRPTMPHILVFDNLTMSLDDKKSSWKLKYLFRIFTARAMLSAVLGVVILSVCSSVRPAHVCFVTNTKNLPATFWYYMKGQSF